MLQIIIKPKNIHSTWVQLIGLIAFIFELFVNVTLMLSIHK